MSRLAQFSRRVTQSVTTLLLIGVTLSCAAYIVPGFFGFERYVITGGSMSGTFEKGSLAFEKQVPVDDLAVGDVITYLPPADSGVATLVTHRIVSMAPGEDGKRVLVTQGDANPDPDPWKFSLTSTTQPVVVETVPHVGHIFIALANPQIRMIAIGIPAAFIALMALRDLLRALRPVTSPHRGRTPGLSASGDPSPA